MLTQMVRNLGDNKRSSDPGPDPVPEAARDR